MKKIFIKNKKGLKISAIVHKPGKTGKFPAIILLHGFTGYKDEKHIIALAGELEKNDFVVIRFDASGFGESEGTIEHDYRLSNYYKDIESVFEYAKSLNFINTDKLGIWGNSLGGTLAIAFSANNSQLKAVCVVSAPTEFARKDNFEKRTKAWKETGYFERESSKYGHIKIPYDFVIDGKKWNALDFVQKITKPILFIVGTTDKNVPPENTKEIYNLANQPKQLIEIEGMTHFYNQFQKQIINVNSLIVSFYKNSI